MDDKVAQVTGDCIKMRIKFLKPVAGLMQPAAAPPGLSTLP